MTDERGAAAVEFAVIVPVLILLLGTLIAGGRLWFARASVEQISQTAARAASLSRTAAEAQSAAGSLVRTQAATAGLSCAPLRVTVDTSGFGLPPGRPATVRVSVTCAVPLADLVVPGLPGHWLLQASGASVLDTYRGRG